MRWAAGPRFRAGVGWEGWGGTENHPPMPEPVTRGRLGHWIGSTRARSGRGSARLNRREPADARCIAVGRCNDGKTFASFRPCWVSSLQCRPGWARDNPRWSGQPDCHNIRNGLGGFPGAATYRRKRVARVESGRAVEMLREILQVGILEDHSSLSAEPPGSIHQK